MISGTLSVLDELEPKHAANTDRPDVKADSAAHSTTTIFSIPDCRDEAFETTVETRSLRPSRSNSPVRTQSLGRSNSSDGGRRSTDEYWRMALGHLRQQRNETSTAPFSPPPEVARAVQPTPPSKHEPFQSLAMIEDLPPSVEPTATAVLQGPADIDSGTDRPSASPIQEVPSTPPRRKRRNTGLEIHISNEEVASVTTPHGHEERERRWTVVDVSPLTSPVAGAQNFNFTDAVSSLGLELMRTTDLDDADSTSGPDDGQHPDSQHPHQHHHHGAKRYILRRVPSSRLGYLTQQLSLLVAPSVASEDEPDLELSGALEEMCTCNVCLERTHTCVLLQPCMHNFDARCLYSWLLRSDKCPLCRSTITQLQLNPVLQRMLDQHNRSINNPHLDTPFPDFSSLPAHPSERDVLDRFMTYRPDGMDGSVSVPVSMMDDPHGPSSGLLACNRALHKFQSTPREESLTFSPGDISFDAIRDRIRRLLDQGQEILIMGESDGADEIRRFVRQELLRRRLAHVARTLSAPVRLASRWIRSSLTTANPNPPLPPTAHLPRPRQVDVALDGAPPPSLGRTAPPPVTMTSSPTHTPSHRGSDSDPGRSGTLSSEGDSDASPSPSRSASSSSSSGLSEGRDAHSSSWSSALGCLRCQW